MRLDALDVIIVHPPLLNQYLRPHRCRKDFLSGALDKNWDRVYCVDLGDLTEGDCSITVPLGIRSTPIT